MPGPFSFPSGKLKGRTRGSKEIPMHLIHACRSGSLLVALVSFLVAAGDRADGGSEPGVGACELVNDQTCVQLTPSQCEAAGGVFHGGPCEVPGACCIDGQCAMLNVYVCRS